MLAPPLSRWEKRALWLWGMVSGTAAAGMALGVFWWWIVFFITIPFVLAAYYAPTLWLYFTPALLIWMVLRRRPLVAALTVAAALVGIALGVREVVPHLDRCDRPLPRPISDGKGLGFTWIS